MKVLIAVLLAFGVWLFFIRNGTSRDFLQTKKKEKIPHDGFILDSLKKYFPYYSHLNPTVQKVFLGRLKQFMRVKVFIPRQMEHHPVVNVLISATAVQLTFGLDTFAFTSFERILVYPDNYYSTIRQRFHQGEVNVPMRLIVLSARHFLAGLLDPNDGVNLGLHEMAHAFQIEGVERGDNNFVIPFKKWESVASYERDNIHANPNHFLRKYALENTPELFAVCIENFFERPEVFAIELPEVYNALCDLLRQNPLNLNDPRKSTT